jgi:cystatin-related protein
MEMNICYAEIIVSYCFFFCDNNYIFFHDYINFCVQNDVQNKIPQLQLVKLLKARYRVFDIFRFFITFEAKDIAAGGRPKVYQAVVREPLPGHGDISVLSFRECEREQGIGISFKGRLI